MNPDRTPPTPLRIRPKQVKELFGIDAEYLERVIQRADPKENAHILARARKKIGGAVTWNVRKVDQWIENTY